jgi:hypothetical protein
MLSLPLSLLARMWTLLSRKTHQLRFAVATESGRAGDVLTKEAKVEARRTTPTYQNKFKKLLPYSAKPTATSEQCSVHRV